MKLNERTLTPYQKGLIKLGYKIYLSENNKLVTEEPIAPFTSEFIEYKKELINKEFQNSINQFTAGYSQAEIDSWNKKVEEAKKFNDTGISTFINDLVIEGETAQELADNILLKADLFTTAYAKAEKIKREKLKLLELTK